MNFDEFYDVFGHYFSNKKLKYGEISFESNEREATCFLCPVENWNKINLKIQ